jgi:hypothetical protein
LGIGCNEISVSSMFAELLNVEISSSESLCPYLECEVHAYIDGIQK